MEKKRYSDEFKLQVVKEYLNSSLGCRTIAKKYVFRDTYQKQVPLKYKPVEK